MRVWRLALWWAAFYLLFCAIMSIPLSDLAFHRSPTPPDIEQVGRSIAARYGGVLEDVSITALDGVSLQGWFTRPANGNGSAILLLHGVGDNRTGMVGYAEMFLSHGYAVLMPDSRGHGTSGGFPTYGIKETADVQGWYEWLRRRGETQCVYGMGESMGAAIILQAAQHTCFCAVVAESPFSSFRHIAYIRVGQIFYAGKWVGEIALRPAVEFAFLYGRLTRGVYLPDAAPESSVAGSTVPTLLIHSLADASIPARESEIIAARNPRFVTLWEVPDGSHSAAIDAAGAEFRSRVPGWFSSHQADAGCVGRTR